MIVNRLALCVFICIFLDTLDWTAASWTAASTSSCVSFPASSDLFLLFVNQPRVASRLAVHEIAFRAKAFHETAFVVGNDLVVIDVRSFVEAVVDNSLGGCRTVHPSMIEAAMCWCLLAAKMDCGQETD